MAVRTAWRKRY